VEEASHRATILTGESGKLIRDARRECSSFPTNVAVMTNFLAALKATTVVDEQSVVEELHRPIGIALIIVPYNSPIALAGLHVIPALLAGNTVIVKAPPQCPLAMVETLVAIARRLPEGVMNVVAGPDDQMTKAIMQDRRIGVIGFTGSTKTAVAITRSLNDVKRLVFELGGNDAAIVCEDAELGEAIANDLVASALLISGQFCAAVKRIYVHRSRAAELQELLLAKFNEQVVGDGLDERVTVGPLISASARDNAEALVRQARSSGAQVFECGEIADDRDFKAGYFVRPTLIFNPSQRSDVVQKEQFAPILPVLAVESDDEAIRYANDSEYGLSGSVWSGSQEHAFKLAAQVETGSNVINSARPRANIAKVPFGGAKQSGIGRTGGAVGLLAYSELQHNFEVRK
jgi:acyl-CoA reductase-like NAD-dependent aldehyde dehydrogenase